MRYAGLFRIGAAAQAFAMATRSPLISAHLRTVAELEALGPAEVAAWQAARLDRFRRRHLPFVPYYRDQPAYLREDLGRLPVLTKDLVRQAASSFTHPWVPARRVSTGGTSGRPLDLRISYPSFFTEWAHIAHVWARAGVRLTDPKITFRGGSLGQGFSGRPILYQPTYNQLLVSPFHLSDRTFDELAPMMRDFRPAALWGYPSAITPFARWVARTGPHPGLRGIRGVLLASEGAFDWQLRLFEDVFQAPVIRWYGQSEKVVFAGECARRRSVYHAIPTYGVAEVVDGRIVGTGLTNAAMPLVRYDTEDAAAPLEPGTDRCACGSPFPALSGIQGRWDQSLVYGADDEPISTAALNFHDDAFAAFDRFQFRQERRGEVELRVTARQRPSAADLERARLLLQERVGDRLAVSALLVSSTDLVTSRGKAIVVDQRYRPDARTSVPTV
jgi:phenylacetate-CoA ligase